MGGSSCSPKRFLKEQVQLWTSLWDNTQDPEVLDRVKGAILESRQEALNSSPPVIELSDFIHTLKTYHKDSKGWIVGLALN